MEIQDSLVLTILTSTFQTLTTRGSSISGIYVQILVNDVHFSFMEIVRVQLPLFASWPFSLTLGIFGIGLDSTETKVKMR